MISIFNTVKLVEFTDHPGKRLFMTQLRQKKRYYVRNIIFEKVLKIPVSFFITRFTYNEIV
jgi:hypothetical protein